MSSRKRKGSPNVQDMDTSVSPPPTSSPSPCKRARVSCAEGGSAHVWVDHDHSDRVVKWTPPDRHYPSGVQSAFALEVAMARRMGQPLHAFRWAWRGSSGGSSGGSGAPSCAKAGRVSVEPQVVWPRYELLSKAFPTSRFGDNLDCLRRVVHDVTRQLAEAHVVHGVVHADIAPDQVLWDPTAGRAVVIDWANAHLAAHPRSGFGKFDFRPPELLHPSTTRADNGPAVDVWALGVTVLMWLLHSNVFFQHIEDEDSDEGKALRHAGMQALLRPHGSKRACQHPKWLFRLAASRTATWSTVRLNAVEPIMHWLARALHPEASQRATMTDLLLDPWLGESHETVQAGLRRPKLRQGRSLEPLAKMAIHGPLGSWLNAMQEELSLAAHVIDNTKRMVLAVQLGGKGQSIRPRNAREWCVLGASALSLSDALLSNTQYRLSVFVEECPAEHHVTLDQLQHTQRAIMRCLDGHLLLVA